MKGIAPRSSLPAELKVISRKSFRRNARCKPRFSRYAADHSDSGNRRRLVSGRARLRSANNGLAKFFPEHVGILDPGFTQYPKVVCQGLWLVPLGFVLIAIDIDGPSQCTNCHGGYDPAMRAWALTEPVIAEAVDVLRQWQGIERDAIETTAQIMEKTDNLLIRQIMEIIRNDSVQHHRVQQFIIDSLTKTPVSLTPEELGEVWDEITAHDEVERQTIEIAKKLKEECRFFVQRALLDYLIVDEEKHDQLLSSLEDFKKNLYPYG